MAQNAWQQIDKHNGTQPARNEGDLLDEDDSSITDKMEALTFFQKAVKHAVQGRMNEQEQLL